jgi:hypothetical protein
LTGPRPSTKVAAMRLFLRAILVPVAVVDLKLEK